MRRTADRIAGHFILSWGIRRSLYACAAGAISALAMPPFDIFAVLFLTIPVLIWLITIAVVGLLIRRQSRLAVYLIVSRWKDEQAFKDFVASDAFKKVTNWGALNILRGRPQHTTYQHA